MTKGMDPPESETREDEPRSAAPRTPTVIWVHDHAVCVTIVDSPPAHVGSGVCRCPACRGSPGVDLAQLFFDAD